MTLDRLVAGLQGVPPRRRIVLAVAAAALLAVAALAASAARDTRVALFATPLHPEQVAEVETRLAGWNVPFASLPDNVRVERAKRGDLLLRLALAGVPHPHLAGTGEALAHVGALAPQAVLEAQTRDALAADLALALRGVDGIADARVVIAPAAGGIYADDAVRDATAAVRVQLAAGARLAPRTVGGIRAFVAGGVPGLAAEHVTVLDDRGIALDPGAGGGDDGGDVQAALQSALDAAFGAGATIVRVHREPLGESRDVHDVRRAALAAPVVRSARDERYATAHTSYAKNDVSEDRGSDTHDERRVAAAGTTARLSVAVFADRSRGLDLGAIRALAAAATGVRADRGDVVIVRPVAFAAVPAAGPHRWSALASLLPQALAGIAAVLAAAFAARPVAGLAARVVDLAGARRAARRSAGLPPGGVHIALAGEPPHVAAAIISALPAATAAAVLELYPAEERRAIVSRLARGAAPDLVPLPEDPLHVRA